jgi:apolipoprotein N-acyltransferase
VPGGRLARPTAAGLAGRLVGAVTAGLGLALAFPPYGWWPLALAAVGALSLLVRGSSSGRAALLGLVFGVAFFLLLARWLLVIGPDAWVLVALVEGAFFALLALGLRVTSPLRLWPLWHAALWLAVEGLRARLPLGGLPWGKLAFSQVDAPFASYAALAGAPLVTFTAALAGTVLAAGLLVVRTRPLAAAAAGLAALAVGVLGLAVPPPAPATRQVTAAVVQGNVPRLGLDFFGQREQVLRNHVRATHVLAERVRAGTLPKPDLVIWPENASDIDPYGDVGARALIDQAVQDVGAPVLVGAVAEGPDPEHVRNLGIVWMPEEGAGATYLKRHPVPFGEYVPLRSLLQPWIGRLNRIPRDFSAGDRPGVLDLGPTRVGVVICFEIAYDDLVRDTVRGGGQALVVQTNNATYGRTGQPEQQLGVSRLRAIEHGRTLLVAATSGISAVVTPDGAVVDRSREFVADLLVERVPVRTTRTLATRTGAWPELLLGLLGVAGVVAGRTRRGRGSGRVPTTATVTSPEGQPERAATRRART